MKLLSTEFGEKSIELLYADNPDTDAASTLLLVRLPKEVDHSKPLAWHRFHALGDLQELIRGLRSADRDTLESF